MKNSTHKLSFLLFLSILSFSCSSEKEIAKTIPQLSTNNASNITLTTATSGGNITTDGGAPVTSRGIVWNTVTQPTVSLATKTTDGSGIGDFPSAITNLTPSTNYYARAYATNSVGTGYGNEITFTTGAVVLPTLTTTAVSGITTNSALSGGTITADGGAAITARGVVWSTTQNPTITLTTKTSDGLNIGTYTSNITNLSPNTTYYLRAYATNSAGTNYGNEISLKTAAPPIISVTDIDGNIYQTVTICNQVWTKTNLNVSKYRNGDVIPQVTDPTQWRSLTTGAWCYYNNDSANGPIYGKLYNWYAINDSRGLAPTGYHIASVNEWDALSTCLGGNTISGGKMKETGTTHWRSPNTDATNFSGFTGLPGGDRTPNQVFSFDFYGIGELGSWWTTNESNSTNGLVTGLTYNGGNFRPGWFYDSKNSGNSVRCVKD